ncbi:MAG TPA: tetratricopeptide repeat protein [Kofleriaceae bacterium]|nr:tetratricopeptide repeat protein [Kofleriaceae bacterium]
MTRAATATLFLVSALALAPARPALGDPPARPQRAAAKQRAERAAAHYKIGRFAEALTEYTAAYDIAPVPEILFNIGQCHFQLGQFDRAIFFYERYLGDRPDAPNRAQVESLLAEARQNLDRPRAVSLAPSTALSSDAAGEPAAGGLGASLDARAGHDDARPIYRRWWFWTAIGVAAVAAGATVYAVTADPSSDLPERSLGTLDAR